MKGQAIIRRLMLWSNIHIFLTCRCISFGEGLADLEKTLPRIILHLPEPLGHGLRIELRRGQGRRKLIPGNRGGDGRTLPGPRGIRRDGCRTLFVSSVIDVDFAGPLCLARLGNVTIGMLANERIRKGLCEGLEIVPRASANDGHDNMQALASRRSQEALRVSGARAAAYVVGLLARLVPLDPFARINIDDQPVRAVESVLSAAPGMDFQNAKLNERDQPGQVVDREVSGFPAFSLTSIPRTDSRHRDPQVPLVEAGFRRPVGTAHQRQRPAHDVRQDERRDGRVIDGNVALRDPLIREQNPIGMRQPNSGKHIRRLPPCSSLAPRLAVEICFATANRRIESPHLNQPARPLVRSVISVRFFILTKTFKGGMTENPIRRPGGKPHLDDPLGLSPVNHPAPPRCRMAVHKWRLLPFQSLKCLVQISKRLLGEAGAHSPAVDKLGRPAIVTDK